MTPNPTILNLLLVRSQKLCGHSNLALGWHIISGHPWGGSQV